MNQSTYDTSVVIRCAAYIASLDGIPADVISSAVMTNPDAVVKLFTNIAQDPDNKHHCIQGYTLFYLKQIINQ